MNSSTHISSFQLPKYNGLVAAFRIYDFKERQALHLHPEGNLELIFQLSGEFAQQSVKSTEWNVRPQFFLGGLHNHSFAVKSLTPEAKLVSVQFTPQGARSFLNDRLNLYKNSLVNLEELELPEFTLDSPKIANEQIINRVDTYLTSIYSETHRNVIDAAVALLLERHGFITIKTLCKKFNVSPSYFRTKFNEQVGMSPKEYSRILRVKHTVNQLQSTPTGSLTALSHQLGYFDQSHFIRDFKLVTGKTPGNYLKT